MPQTPLVGKLRYCQPNSPDLGGTVPVLVSRRTCNREKKILETYVDIDAPSVVTVLVYQYTSISIPVYQLKYADAVSSGVTYKSWVSTNARCYETASCLIEKHGQFFFHATRGNGGCFAATNPNQWSPTDYVYNYIYEWAPPFHQSWIRYWNISMSWQWELPEVLPPPLPICWI